MSRQHITHTTTVGTDGVAIHEAPNDAASVVCAVQCEVRPLQLQEQMHDGAERDVYAIAEGKGGAVELSIAVSPRSQVALLYPSGSAGLTSIMTFRR